MLERNYSEIKICVPKWNLNKDTKPKWEIRLGQKLPQAKVLRKKKHARIYWDQKPKQTAGTTWNSTGRFKSKDFDKRKDLS